MTTEYIIVKQNDILAIIRIIDRYQLQIRIRFEDRRIVYLNSGGHIIMAKEIKYGAEARAGT